MDSLSKLFMDPNALWIFIGCTLLGFSSGILGCFAYLRRQALIGDALAHAVLPGVCIAFMISGNKSILLFFIGAIGSGLLATSAISIISRYSKIKQDSALGIVLSVFFGFGIVLLSWIQRSGNGNQSGLESYLFGHAASMVPSDLWTMILVSSLILFCCIVFYKELKILSFDVSYTQSLGFSSRLLNQIVMILLVFIVVAGIQAVGVVLIVALLITPAISARYWTDRLHVMLICSGLFGAISGFMGTYLSTLGNDLPTGPLCVIVGFMIFMVSFIVAPRKGLLFKKWLHFRTKKQSQSHS